MLDCTSSLVFFDYMKRFRTQYLRAVFLGEALTSAIPTVLILAQGVAGETICIQKINSTLLEPSYTQPRFSVKIFMFCIAGIIIASLIAFILLRWTSIVRLADAAEKNVREKAISNRNVAVEENLPMVNVIKSRTSSKSIQHMPRRLFFLFLILNTVNSTISFGCLPSLSTYALLPFGQKAFYYWSVLLPIAYPLALLLSIYWKHVSNHVIVLQSIFNWLLATFIFIIARQSPCPWLADTIQGALMIITVWFIMSLTSGFLRITIGNRIKSEWEDDKGMFYYGGTVQLGLLLGTIPIYILINVFGVFIDRKPCRAYCFS
ncbi:unnamed protein product [Rotaria sp. Silwood1]|nr:unnamed protein product [Rotaria sp. Silwood1]CAF3395868.1 unnamed protein product [Rotaria sp. Silwood1]CAF3428876.1 unnamed protein product [Rotaria sp. Silwood1]CAF4578217.1 unnamed protein product [Rotaria sp. Silwood1]